MLRLSLIFLVLLSLLYCSQAEIETINRLQSSVLETKFPLDNNKNKYLRLLKRQGILPPPIPNASETLVPEPSTTTTTTIIEAVITSVIETTTAAPPPVTPTGSPTKSPSPPSPTKSTPLDKDQTSNTSLSIGLIVGIVIGVLVLVFGIAGYIYFRRSRLAPEPFFFSNGQNRNNTNPFRRNSSRNDIWKTTERPNNFSHQGNNNSNNFYTMKPGNNIVVDPNHGQNPMGYDPTTNTVSPQYVLASTGEPVMLAPVMYGGYNSSTQAMLPDGTQIALVPADAQNYTNMPTPNYSQQYAEDGIMTYEFPNTMTTTSSMPIVSTPQVLPPEPVHKIPRKPVYEQQVAEYPLEQRRVSSAMYVTNLSHSDEPSSPIDPLPYCKHLSSTQAMIMNPDMVYSDTTLVPSTTSITHTRHQPLPPVIEED